MSDESIRTTPSAPATLEAPPASDAPPMPLYAVLEQEYEQLHKGKLDLNAEYRAARDAGIAKAKSKLKDALRERPACQGMTETQLDAEVEREVKREPALINAPACRELFQHLHRFVEQAPGETKPHTALCLSGGGIRSATFALGVLQGLASRGVLSGIDYLSTVSGGGYIGSWLSSWILHKKDPEKVFQKLAVPERPAVTPSREPLPPAPVRDPKQPFRTEPQSIRHLRDYSNYLTPSLGLLSGDGWAVAATVLRNLLLNWLLIIPALICVLMLPRFALQVEVSDLGAEQGWRIAVSAVGFLAGVFELGNIFARRGTSQARVLWYNVAPVVVFSACATVAWFWSRRADPGTGEFDPDLKHVAFYMGWGALTPLLALPYGAWLRRGKKEATPATESQHTTLRKVFVIGLVFAFTGLAVCWFGDNAAESFIDRSKPAAASTAPSAEWALLSQKKEDCTLAQWVKLDPAQHGAITCPAFFRKAEEPRKPWEVTLGAGIMSISFGFPLLLALIFAANTLITGLLSHRMVDEDREWISRVSGWAFLVAIATCALNLIVFYGGDCLVGLWGLAPKLVSAALGGSAFLTIGGGQSALMPVTDRADEKLDLKGRITGWAVKLAAPIFIVLLLMIFTLLTTFLLQKTLGQDVNAQQHGATLVEAGFLPLVVVFIAGAIVAAGASYCVNINKFSLHAMYRNRLIRAYLGATNRHREPNPFTGFDPKDNFGLSEMHGQRPLHVVNTALNLVAGKDLAWQQRLATSFTMSPYACGSSSLGYREAARYASGSDGRGMTLGTALAISGAAVSPNHGYNSTPIVAFLLTFFNARLGGWFGNPGPAGGQTWERTSPNFAITPIVAEALGLTDADHPYVNLSDGGHFENLGLYEMVLRRCRTIIVSDGGCDPDYGFEDLGNAIAKIRVDFGIPITFSPHLDIRKHAPDFKGIDGKHCAVGTIHYSDVDGGGPDRNGTLIYIKPAMCGNEPMDVFHYFREHPEFPHEPTSDQWFSESQFESYRALGAHTIEEICRGAQERVTSLGRFAVQATAYAAETSDNPKTT